MSSIEQMLIVDSVNGMPNFSAAARGVDLAVGMLHAGQADRRDGHRHLHVAWPTIVRRGAAVFHVHRDALAQLDLAGSRLSLAR